MKKSQLKKIIREVLNESHYDNCNEYLLQSCTGKVLKGYKFSERNITLIFEGGNVPEYKNKTITITSETGLIVK